jgi:hypothetical protein
MSDSWALVVKGVVMALEMQLQVGDTPREEIHVRALGLLMHEHGVPAELLPRVQALILATEPELS